MRRAIAGSARNQVPTAITVAWTLCASSRRSKALASAGSPAPWNVSATSGAVRLPWRISTASRTILVGAAVVADAAVDVGVALEVGAAGEPERLVAVDPAEPSEQ